jgi:hypothetical protein
MEAGHTPLTRHYSGDLPEMGACPVLAEREDQDAYYHLVAPARKLEPEFQDREGIDAVVLRAWITTGAAEASACVRLVVCAYPASTRLATQVTVCGNSVPSRGDAYRPSP